MSVQFEQLSMRIGQSVAIDDRDRGYTLKGILRVVADLESDSFELSYDSEVDPPARLSYNLDATAFTQGAKENVFTSTKHGVTITFNPPP